MALVRNHLQQVFCGFSRSFFVKSTNPNINFTNIQNLSPLSIIPVAKYSRYTSSPPVTRSRAIVSEYEIVRNPPEWKYVENVLPFATVPKPPETGEFASGWKPQNPELYAKLPYFVKRNKNHMIPVYLRISNRLMRKMTLINHVYGDIWTLSEDIEKYLKEKHKRTFAVRVNEFAGFIQIRGDFVLDTREYLLSVGL